MLVATAIVLMMTLPGLALFYCGMVRKKNVLATMAQSFAAAAVVSVLWMIFGYGLSFTGDGAYIGGFDRIFLTGITMTSVSPFAKTIPEILFMMYQMTFAIITVALVAGAVAERMRFSAFMLFSVLWLTFVYIPIAHWVWGGGFLASAGLLDFAGGTVVHINAGIAGLVAALMLGKRKGYGYENLAPYDLSMAVVGTGLLWVGWFGFNGGSAYGGQFARGHGDCRDAPRRERRRSELGGHGMDHARQAVRPRPDFGRGRGTWHGHGGVRLYPALARRRDRRPRRRGLLLRIDGNQALARL